MVLTSRTTSHTWDLMLVAIHEQTDITVLIHNVCSVKAVTYRATLQQCGNCAVCQLTETVARSDADPGAPPIYFNDGGGSDRGSYFNTQKIPTSKFVYPQKILTFFIIPKKIPTQTVNCAYIIVDMI